MNTTRSCTMLLLALVLALASPSWAGGVQITGSLANFDVRYPPSLPNDFEIVSHGDGLATAELVSTFANSQWGTASSITGAVNNDPSSTAFGLNGITARYVGPPLPASVGQLLTFGTRWKIGAAAAHQELWWTINGVRILRSDNAQVIWHVTKNGWLIELNNPGTTTIYVYGARFFAPAAGSPLPTATQLTTSINPAAFGAAGWSSLSLPGGQVVGINAGAHIFLKVAASAPVRPVVFQIATRNVDEATLPLPVGTTGPNPNDFDGTNGTMTIQTTRAAEEFPDDLDSNGAVGTSDFNQLRSRFGKTSADQ